MSYPTFKQTLLGGSNGFKPTNPLGAFPAGVSAFDRTFTREYNNQRGAALNQQQTQRAFNSGYRRLMQGARGGDPRALGAMMQLAPNYQRAGVSQQADYAPAARDQLIGEEYVARETLNRLPEIEGAEYSSARGTQLPYFGDSTAPDTTASETTDARSILAREAVAKRKATQVDQGAFERAKQAMLGYKFAPGEEITRDVEGIGEAVSSGNYYDPTFSLRGPRGGGTSDFTNAPGRPETVVSEIDPTTGEKIQMSASEWFKRQAAAGNPNRLREYDTYNLELLKRNPRRY